MADNAQPSVDPANNGTLLGMLRHFVNKFLQGVDDMLPAKVISYDRTKNIATIQPMIMMLTTEGNTISRAQVEGVPVFQLGAGGAMLNFNLNPGDLGWLKASDRDISLFKQSFTESGINTLRKHSFEDAIFLPHVMNGYTIESEDGANAVLSTIDGSQRVAIWPNKIKVTGTNVDVVATTEASITAPTVTITASTSITLASPLTTITGELAAGGTGGADANFTGNINTTKTVTGTTEVIGGGKHLSTHVHSGVQPGGGNTGAPV